MDTKPLCLVLKSRAVNSSKTLPYIHEWALEGGLQLYFRMALRCPGKLLGLHTSMDFKIFRPVLNMPPDVARVRGCVSALAICKVLGQYTHLAVEQAKKSMLSMLVLHGQGAWTLNHSV